MTDKEQDPKRGKFNTEGPPSEGAPNSDESTMQARLDAGPPPGPGEMPDTERRPQLGMRLPPSKVKKHQD